jgi:ubiquinone/menaquinone biosynthesis C-methylase UbiE
VNRGDSVLEIGPGGGRWTTFLADRAAQLIVADVAPACLDVCRKRFVDADHIRYLLVDATCRLDIPDDSIDSVWSYDVFVHIGPSEADRYLGEIRRVLRPGGRATIHHAGDDHGFSSDVLARSDLTATFFTHLARERGLLIASQDRELPHKPGDVISVLTV